MPRVGGRHRPPLWVARRGRRRRRSLLIGEGLARQRAHMRRPRQPHGTAVRRGWSRRRTLVVAAGAVWPWWRRWPSQSCSCSPASGAWPLDQVTNSWRAPPGCCIQVGLGAVAKPGDSGGDLAGHHWPITVSAGLLGACWSRPGWPTRSPQPVGLGSWPASGQGGVAPSARRRRRARPNPATQGNGAAGAPAPRDRAPRLRAWEGAGPSPTAPALRSRCP